MTVAPRSKAEDRAHPVMCALVASAALLVLLAADARPAWAQPAEGGPRFALQLNASEDAALIAGQLDSLRRLGLPAYRTQTQRGGATYHRLRLGPFPSQAVAETFARCQPDAWLVPADGRATPSSGRRVVRGAATEVVPLRPRRPRFLLGRRAPFAAFLMPAYGPGADEQPATLRVYAPGREAPAVVERVTGVREADGDVLEYGRAERVFVRAPARADSSYTREVRAFSRQHGLSSYLVEDQLALYGGSDGAGESAGAGVARFTLLGTLALPSGAPQTHGQPGFDFVNDRGEAVRYRGASGGEEARRTGHADVRRLRRAGRTHALTERTLLLARPTARGENAEVCLLFFED